MTLLGDLYSNGYAFPRTTRRRLPGSLSPRTAATSRRFSRSRWHASPPWRRQDLAEAAALLDKAAKLVHIAAAYNLALLHLEVSRCARTLRAAAELLRIAADAGSPEAQYALATLYKDGNGVPKDPLRRQAVEHGCARGNIAAEVEYAIALFNGTGIAKDENAAAALFRQSGAKGQCGRAKPPRAHSGDRPRHARRSLRCREMAYHRQGGRYHGRVAGRVHAQDQGCGAHFRENAARSGWRTPSEY